MEVILCELLRVSPIGWSGITAVQPLNFRAQRSQKSSTCSHLLPLILQEYFRPCVHAIRVQRQSLSSIPPVGLDEMWQRVPQTLRPTSNLRYKPSLSSQVMQLKPHVSYRMQILCWL